MEIFFSEDENCDRCKVETTHLHLDSMMGYCEIISLNCGLVWIKSSDFGTRLKRCKIRDDSLEEVNWVRNKLNMNLIQKLSISGTSCELYKMT